MTDRSLAPSSTGGIRKIPDTILDSLARAGARFVAVQTDTLDGFLGERITSIISLAGQTNVDDALQLPYEAFEANVKIAINLGEFLRLNKYKPALVYLSSDEVLGPSFAPLHEDAPLRPTQPYAASKAAAEMILHNYRDVYGLHVMTLRSCNLVGSQQRARKLIPIAVNSLCTSSPVPVFGDGHHLREWMAVEDLCAAILNIIRGPAKSTVFQASSNIHISARDVVGIVARALDREPRIRFVPDRLINDESYSMQIGRLTSLGWKAHADPRSAIVTASRALAAPQALEELKLTL